MNEEGWTKRLKSYFKEERQKLQGYSFKEKIKYIFDYYWLWMLGFVVVLFFAGNLLWHGLTESGQIYSGAALMKAGIPLPIQMGDYRPVQFYFKEVTE